MGGDSSTSASSLGQTLMLKSASKVMAQQQQVRSSPGLTVKTPHSSPVLSHKSSTASAVPPPVISPPRIEIKKVEPASSGLQSAASASATARLMASLPRLDPIRKAAPAVRKVGRATPFEGHVQLESIKARALRDVQLAHSKDIHGNL